MNEEAGFLRMICLRTAQGLDTTAERLVFADWLEENGQSERAEFIRVQCELAKREGPWKRTVSPNDDSFAIPPSTEALRRRERELLDKHGCDWSGLESVKRSGEWIQQDGINRPGGVSGRQRIGWEFRRGFVAKVRCSFREWCGEACPCERLATDSYYMPRLEPCIWCHGTGRVNALGPKIVAAAPIEEFEAVGDGPAPDLPWDALQLTREDNNRRALVWAREQAFGRSDIAAANRE